MNISDKYKSFLSDCKTERECVNFFKRGLINEGFEDMFGKTVVNEGDKIVSTKMDKTLIAFKVGKQPLEAGLNILCAHVDSPSIDIDGFGRFHLKRWNSKKPKSNF